MISGNGSLPIISILILIFSMLLISEVFKLKKIQRRLVKKIENMKIDLDALKEKKEGFSLIICLVLYQFGQHK